MKFLGQTTAFSIARFAEKGVSFAIILVCSRFFGAEGVGEFFITLALQASSFL